MPILPKNTAVASFKKGSRVGVGKAGGYDVTAATEKAFRNFLEEFGQPDLDRCRFVGFFTTTETHFELHEEPEDDPLSPLR